MGNCLVTKLKGEVNNSSLPIFNAFILDVTNITESNHVFTVNGNVGDVITIEATDNRIQFNEQTAPTNRLQFTCTSTNKTVYCYPGSYRVIIKSKYNIKWLSLTETISMNIDNIGFANLTTFSCQYGDSYTERKTYGDISSIGNLINLKALTLIKTAVTGSIQSFVESQVKNGRSSVTTSNALALSKTTTSIPLGNTYTNANYNWYLSWESKNKIFIFNNSNFAQSQYIYCYGYTDTEIATNTASGGIWEGKTVTKCD